MHKYLLTLALAAFSMSVHVLKADGQDLAYLNYIRKYSTEAVRQMEKYGIPASITLAQGILESDAGRSMLAVEGNNHFGIKCHSDWTGRTMYYDDDRRDECFRKYSSAKESFEDHSLFLRNGSRYSSLFKLKTTDYKGWARGLKQAGYATSPTYAEKLISLIERYNLDAYDRGVAPLDGSINGLDYVLLDEGETLRDIARSHKILKADLRRYNDLPRGITPDPGSIIYLEKKKLRAERGNDTCIAGPDDSLWSISQEYGVRLKALMRKNGMETATIYVGQTIRLR